ncbi:MAG: energy-coupled thiamine transporter ThiT [Clostridia bacterium]|nr:energy-coupled thiamine transporter ThiT [Clostridia bacterium]
MQNLLASYLVDTLEPYVKWISIGLFIALAVIAAIAQFTKNKTAIEVLKSYALCLLVYVLAVGIAMLVLDIYKHFNAAYLKKNWVNKDVIYLVLIPLAATLLLSLGAVVYVYLIKKRGEVLPKKPTFILAAVCIIAFMVSLVLIAVYYSKHINGDGYYTADGTDFSQLALYISAVLLIAIIALSAYFFNKNDAPFNAKILARAGICLSLSFALSYVKLFSMPQGGSITLASMLPIMIFAYMYGARKGIFVGLIYGVLQSLQSPYIIHPAQFLLDYPIAFASLGLAGILKDLSLPHAAKFTLGAIIGGTMRYFSHVLSGAFAFGAYAEGQNVLLYSLAYNSFVFIDLVLVVIVGVVLTYNKNFRNLFKV